jgi:hypothetical protein
MMFLWTLFGMFIGAGSGVEASGFAEVLAGIIAGALVMPWPGLCVGLLGGEVQPTLLGGVTGAIVGMFTAILCPVAPILPVAQVGLIGGALAGATVPMFMGQLRWQGKVLRTVLRIAFAPRSSGSREQYSAHVKRVSD